MYFPVYSIIISIVVDIFFFGLMYLELKRCHANRNPEQVTRDVYDLARFFALLSQSHLRCLDGEIKATILAAELGLDVPHVLKGFAVTTPLRDKNFCYDKGLPPSQMSTFIHIAGAQQKLTTSYHYVACGDVPVFGKKCIAVCITHTNEFGGGCLVFIH
jgi:hypothetical protein